MTILRRHGSNVYVASVPPDVLHGIYPDENGEMQGVLAGVGGLSVARVADIWLPDYLGVYNQFLGGEIGYRDGLVSGAPGSRVVSSVQGEEIPYVVYAPQATQLQVNSNLASAWNTVGGAIVTQAGPGLDGTTDGAVTLGDVDAGASVFASMPLTLSATATHYVFRMAVAYDASPAGYMRVSLGVDSLPREIFHFHPGTGVISDLGGTGAKHVTRGMDESGPYWFIYVEFYNSVSATNFTTAVYPAFGSDLVGSVVVGNTELYEADSYLDVIDYPPIFTDGAAVTRDADGYSFDSANWSDTEGTVYLEADINGDCNVLGDFLYVTSGLAELSDGTNTALNATAISGTCQIGFTYDETADGGSGEMRLNVDGTWGTAVAYDGSLLSGAFDLFRNGPFVASVRDIRIWSVSDESLIDGLM